MMRKIKIGFTDFWPDFVSENHFLVKILRKYFDVEIIDTHNRAGKGEVEYLFCSVFSQDFLDYDCLRILYTGEDIIPDFNLYDYAIGYERMEVGNRYFCDPLFYGYLRGSRPDMPDRSGRMIAGEDFRNRKFCAMLVSNGTNADAYRTDFFHRLSEYKRVDSGGAYLNNIGYRVDDKLSFLKNYKFSLAMENVSHEGYCTEKILDSFLSGTVPIYWGDERVTDYFNEKAFINCGNDLSMDQIIEEIKRIDNDDEKYLSMLMEPVFASDYYNPKQQDIRLEHWLVSIFEREYRVRRSREGSMKSYEQRCRKQRDLAENYYATKKESFFHEVESLCKTSRIVIWGNGVRGKTLQGLCRDRGMDLLLVTDAKNDRVGEMTEYGYPIIDTGEAETTADVIIATNDRIYQYLRDKYGERYKLINGVN